MFIYNIKTKNPKGNPTPLHLDVSRFTKGGDVNYKWNADGKIGFLSVDEYPIIGKMPTVFKKIILVILGIIFIIPR